MSQSIFVTGATGFVGSAVVGELRRRGFLVNTLVRTAQTQAPPTQQTLPSQKALPPTPLPEYQEGEKRVVGDLFDSAALDEGLRGCSAVIHLVGIILEKPAQGVTFERIHFEGTRAIVDAAKRNGVRRYIQMSAIGARAGAVSDYHRTKWRAEEYVRASGLDWTIFRPSMIHGPGGAFLKQAAAWARRGAMPFLFMPYFGSGLIGTGKKSLVQPVFVGDVARAFADSVEKPQTIGKTYDLGGADRMTWPAMYKAIARAVVGKNRMTLPIPAWYAKAITHVAPAALLPFNRDQVIMSQEDSVADLTPFTNDFGWQPAAFEASLGTYASELRK